MENMHYLVSNGFEIACLRYYLVSNVFEITCLRACHLTTHLEQFTYAFHHVAAFCIMRNLVILPSPSFLLGENEVKKAF